MAWRYMRLTALLSTPYYSGTWEGLPGVSGTCDPLTYWQRRRRNGQEKGGARWQDQKGKATELKSLDVNRSIFNGGGGLD